MKRSVSNQNTNTQNIDVIATKLILPEAYFSMLGVNFHMFGIIREQLQIFKSIIKSVSVDVVYNFIFGKKPANFIFHYQSLFRNPFVVAGKWMMWLPNRIIPTRIYRSSSKIMMTHRVATLPRTKHLFNMFISSKLFSATKAGSISKGVFSFTFSRTKYPFPISRVIFKYFRTITTGIFFHLNPSYQEDVAE